MTEEKAIPLLVRPSISYPREAEIGKSYLMTIDLDHLQEGDKWPYEEEEYPVYCMLQTSPLFTNKPLDTPAVVLHRFGGSYGPAKFILTASEKELEGEIRVTLVNGQGVPLQVIRLPEIRVVREPSRKTNVVGKFETSQQRSNTNKSTPAKKPVVARQKQSNRTRQKALTYSKREISLLRLQQDVHRALIRMWHKESSNESPLHYLSLFHQFRRQGYSIHKATNQIILKGLAVLEKNNPKRADLLRKRFIDEWTAYEVANYLNISQSYVFYFQKKAKDNLSSILFAMEEKATAERQLALKERLGLHIYDRLSLDTLQRDVHQALKLWHKDNSEGSSLDYLYLFQKIKRESENIRQVANKVLSDALDALQVKDLRNVELLRKRFIEGQTIHQVAKQLNVVSTVIYSLQKRAIRDLAEVIHTMELEALQEPLELPPYLDLIGVEEHLEGLTEILVSPEQPYLISIEGIGGIGKTVLADALMRRVIRQNLFGDFGWVTAQQTASDSDDNIEDTDEFSLTTDTLIRILVEQLLDFTPNQLSGTQALKALQYRLKEYPHLIVIDNLEKATDIENLLPTLRILSAPTKFLLTSRTNLYKEPNVYSFVVPELSRDNTLELIRKEARLHNLTNVTESSDKELGVIYEAVGGLPLVLRLIVGQLRSNTLDTVLNSLINIEGKKIENFYTLSYRRIWDNLDEMTRQVFLLMRLVPTQGAEFDYLETISELEPNNLSRSLDSLVSLNLVDIRRHHSERRYTIHNRTRTFLEKQVVKRDSFEASDLHTLLPTNYTDIFSSYILRNFEYIQAKIKNITTNLIPADDVKLALHALSFAFKLDKAWPQVRDLLIVMAPKMEQAGHRGDWIFYLESGIEKSQKLGDLEAEAELCFHLGILYNELARYDQAHHQFELSAAYFEEFGNADKQARALSSLAHVARRQRRFEEASKLVEVALELSAENKDGQAFAYFVLGSIALDKHQLHDAYDFLSKSLALWQETNNQRMIGWGLTNLGVILSLLKKYEDAIAYYKRAINQLEIIQDPVYLAFTRMNLGNVYVELDRFELALELYLLAQPIFHKTQDKLRLAMLNNNKGMVYNKLQQWDEAEKAYKFSIELWQQIGNVASLVNVMDNLGSVYLEQGLYDNAIAIFQDALNQLAQIKGDPSYDFLFDMVTAHLHDTIEQHAPK